MSAYKYEDHTHNELVARILFLEKELVQAKMSLRDKFARAALVGMLGNSVRDYTESNPEGFATDAYAVANAMMAEREQ